jgi:hypothetical protein
MNNYNAVYLVFSVTAILAIIALIVSLTLSNKMPKGML